MSMQPYTGNQMIVVEKRKADGTLDFSHPQPPPSAMTFDQLYMLFFAADRTSAGTWENLSAWLKTKGWTIRSKNW